MGFYLDCETRESTITSLCEGFSCDESTLSSTLRGLDLESIYNNQRPDIPAEEYVYEYIVNNINEHQTLEGTYFFHFTRVEKETDFNEGILPLGLLEDRLWNMLLSLPYDDLTLANLKSMKTDNSLDFQYQFKTGDKNMWGPFGMLIKESIYYADEIGLHNYLDIPEIIEDICNSYEKKFGTSIIDVICKSLVPVTVKFISTQQSGNYIAYALCYAYNIVRELPPSSLSNFGFDGNGEGIPHSSIESVIYE